MRAAACPCQKSLKPEPALLGVGTQMLPNFGSIFNGLLNGSVPASTVAGTAAISTANTSNAGSRCVNQTLACRSRGCCSGCMLQNMS